MGQKGIHCWEDEMHSLIDEVHHKDCNNYSREGKEWKSVSGKQGKLAQFKVDESLHRLECFSGRKDLNLTAGQIKPNLVSSNTCHPILPEKELE